MIQVEHLSKELTLQQGIEDISFQIELGEIVGVLAPRNSGKSALLRLLSGALPPDRGNILLNGFSLQKKPRRAKKQIGYLPQQIPAYSKMTVWEQLDFLYDLKNVQYPRRQHLTELTKTFELFFVQQKLISSLSSTELLLLGMASAFVGYPPILLLDQPTLSRSKELSKLFWDSIHRIQNPTTILFTTTSPLEVELFCDRALILKEGHLLTDCASEHLQNQTNSTQRVELRAKGEKEDIISLLQEIQIVDHWKEDPPMEKGAWDFSVFAAQEEPLRETLFFAFAQKGIPLLSLLSQEHSLEKLIETLRESDEFSYKEIPSHQNQEVKE